MVNGERFNPLLLSTEKNSAFRIPTSDFNSSSRPSRATSRLAPFAMPHALCSMHFQIRNSKFEMYSLKADSFLQITL
jgi:hypothetical protein